MLTYNFLDIAHVSAHIIANVIYKWQEELVKRWYLCLRKLYHYNLEDNGDLYYKKSAIHGEESSLLLFGSK